MKKILILLIIGFVVSPGCSKKKKGKTVPVSEKKDGKSTDTSNKKTDSDNKKVLKESNSGNEDKNNLVQDKTSKDSKDTDKKQSDVKSDSGKKKPSGKILSKKEKTAQEIKEKIFMAKAFVKKGNEKSFVEALDNIKAVLKLDYQNYEAMLLIVEMELARGNFEKMRNVLNRIEVLRSKSKPPTKVKPIWHLYMGKYYLHQARNYESKGLTLAGIFEKGKAEKEFGHSSLKDNSEALFQYGNLLLEKGEYKQALLSYENVLKYGGNEWRKNWKFSVNLGVAYFYSLKYMEAEKQFRHVLGALSVRCMTCHYNLALIYSMWDDIARVGNLTTVERAEYAIKHAVIYRNEERKKRRYDKELVSRLNKWIKQAKERMELAKSRGGK
ncbi:MAG: hypothetical protein JXR95_07260 [Deltaproteobacteria bacterium]|nr:hypothetical protein [Deltaproteobacteria bacterium]